MNQKDDFKKLSDAFRKLQSLKFIDEKKEALLRQTRLDPTHIFNQVSVANYWHFRLNEESNEEDIHSWIQFYDYDGNSRISFSQFQKALNWQYHPQTSRHYVQSAQQSLSDILLEQGAILTQFYRIVATIRTNAKDLARQLDRHDKGFITHSDLQEFLGGHTNYDFIANKISKSNRDKILPKELAVVLSNRSKTFQISASRQLKIATPTRGNKSFTNTLQDRQTIINKLSVESEHSHKTKQFMINGLPIYDSKIIRLKENQNVLDRPRSQYTDFSSNFSKIKNSQAVALSSQDRPRESVYQIERLRGQLERQRSQRKKAQERISRLDAQNRQLKIKIEQLQVSFKQFIGMQGKIQALDKQLHLLSNKERREKEYLAQNLNKEVKDIARGLSVIVPCSAGKDSFISIKQQAAQLDSQSDYSGFSKNNFSSSKREQGFRKENRNQITPPLNRICIISQDYFDYRHKYFVDFSRTQKQGLSFSSLESFLDERVGMKKRLLLVKELKIRYGASNKQSFLRYIHSSKAFVQLTLQQFLRNILIFLQDINQQLALIPCQELASLLGTFQEKVSAINLERKLNQLGVCGKQFCKWLGCNPERSKREVSDWMKSVG